MMCKHQSRPANPVYFQMNSYFLSFFKVVSDQPEVRTKKRTACETKANRGMSYIFSVSPAPKIQLNSKQKI